MPEADSLIKKYASKTERTTLTAVVLAMADAVETLKRIITISQLLFIIAIFF